MFLTRIPPTYNQRIRQIDGHSDGTETNELFVFLTTKDTEEIQLFNPVPCNDSSKNANY